MRLESALFFHIWQQSFATSRYFFGAMRWLLGENKPLYRRFEMPWWQAGSWTSFEQDWSITVAEPVLWPPFLSRLPIHQLLPGIIRALRPGHTPCVNSVSSLPYLLLIFSVPVLTQQPRSMRERCMTQTCDPEVTPLLRLRIYLSLTFLETHMQEVCLVLAFWLRHYLRWMDRRMDGQMDRWQVIDR